MQRRSRRWLRRLVSLSSASAFSPSGASPTRPPCQRHAGPVAALRAASDAPSTDWPQGRYKIMREYMPKVGTMGLDMMFRTCTVQVNLDFSSEEDMVKKFRVGLALQVRAAGDPARPVACADRGCSRLRLRFSPTRRSWTASHAALRASAATCGAFVALTVNRTRVLMGFSQDGRGQGAHRRPALRLRAGLWL